MCPTHSLFAYTFTMILNLTITAQQLVVVLLCHLWVLIFTPQIAIPSLEYVQTSWGRKPVSPEDFSSLHQIKRYLLFSLRRLTAAITAIDIWYSPNVTCTSSL